MRTKIPKYPKYNTYSFETMKYNLIRLRVPKISHYFHRSVGSYLIRKDAIARESSE